MRFYFLKSPIPLEGQQFGSFGQMSVEIKDCLVVGLGAVVTQAAQVEFQTRQSYRRNLVADGDLYG